MKYTLVSTSIIAFTLAGLSPALAVEQAAPVTKTVAKNTAKKSIARKAAAPATAAAPIAESKPVPSWWSGVNFSGYLNVGGMFNTKNDASQTNFGRLIDDQNGPSLNQFSLILERPLHTDSKDYDFGFRVQGMYGSDARISRGTGFLETTTGNSRNQLDVMEAHALIHTPWFTEGGLDLKIGKYFDMESNETMNPNGNFFYSHSYIFNFGDPFNHTGIMGTLHATSWLDIYFGVSSGVNTTMSYDNNEALSYQAALGYHDDVFSSTLTTHIGPELSGQAVASGALPATVEPNRDLRVLSTWTNVWKYTPALTLATDLNWVYDEAINAGKKANGFGVAQYGIYKINDMYSVGVRGEVWRDVEGVFVCQFVGNNDFIRGIKGQAFQNSRSVCGGKTTYGSLTAGVNITPSVQEQTFVKGLTFRPEVRFDTSLNDTRPFNDSRDRNQITIGGDMIINF